jgi:type II secretory pathway pseudopilin PulG
MPSTFTDRRTRERGFSILEMMFATLILLVGLVAIAQLVPASILLNQRNRTDSSALVFAQRELDQFLDQPLSSSSFVDALGNTCQLGNPAPTNSAQGSNVAIFNFQPVVVFGSPPSPQAPTNGWGFTYTDPLDPSGTSYDVRWAVIITGNGSTVSSKRFIVGVQQQGGNGYYQPITIDTTKSKE